MSRIKDREDVLGKPLNTTILKLSLNCRLTTWSKREKMWALKEHRNSSGAAEERFHKPSTGSLAEHEQKMDLHFFVVFPKSNFKINQPCQKFRCSWAGAHPPQEPGPQRGGSCRAAAPLPPPRTCRQNHCLLTLPAPQRRKRLCGRAHCSNGWWPWRGSGTRNSVRLLRHLCSLHLLHHAHLAYGFLHHKPHSTSHMESICVPFHSFKPVMLRHDKDESG